MSKTYARDDKPVDIRLTADEKKAISALHRVAKVWPETLWIFAEDGKLTVMRKNAAGQRAVTDDGGMDPRYIVESAHIESDGGDW